MPFPIALIGTACVMLNTGVIGIYDSDGQCVVKLGPMYARPAEEFDLRNKPKDQHGNHIEEWK